MNGFVMMHMTTISVCQCVGRAAQCSIIDKQFSDESSILKALVLRDVQMNYLTPQKGAAPGKHLAFINLTGTLIRLDSTLFQGVLHNVIYLILQNNSYTVEPRFTFNCSTLT